MGRNTSASRGDDVPFEAVETTTRAAALAAVRDFERDAREQAAMPNPNKRNRRRLAGAFMRTAARVEASGDAKLASRLSRAVGPLLGGTVFLTGQFFSDPGQRLLEKATNLGLCCDRCRAKYGPGARRDWCIRVCAIYFILCEL